MDLLNTHTASAALPKTVGLAMADLSHEVKPNPNFFQSTADQFIKLAQEGYQRDSKAHMFCYDNLAKGPSIVLGGLAQAFYGSGKTVEGWAEHAPVGLVASALNGVGRGLEIAGNHGLWKTGLCVGGSLLEFHVLPTHALMSLPGALYWTRSGIALGSAGQKIGQAIGTVQKAFSEADKRKAAQAAALEAQRIAENRPVARVLKAVKEGNPRQVLAELKELRPPSTATAKGWMKAAMEWVRPFLEMGASFFRR